MKNLTIKTLFLTVLFIANPFFVAAAPFNPQLSYIVESSAETDQVNIGNYELSLIDHVSQGGVNYEIELDEVTGDEYPDLLALDYYGQTISIYEGNGDATFVEDPIIITTNSFGGPAYFTAEDFTGNGLVDIVVFFYTDEGFWSVVVYNQNPEGVFESNLLDVVEETNQYFGKIKTADFDNDGTLDFAVPKTDLGVDGTQEGFVVYFNRTSNPGYGFRSYLLKTSGSHTTLDVGDVDGDGFTDVILGDVYQNYADVFINNGNRTFNPKFRPAPLGESGNAAYVALGDVDNDGDLDALVNRNYDNSLNYTSVALNDGNGFFEHAYFLPGGYIWAYATVVEDLNNDGINDIIQGVHGPFTWFGTKTGFNEMTPIIDLWEIYPYDIEVADLDGDGLKDIVTSNYWGSLGVIKANPIVLTKTYNSVTGDITFGTQ